MNLKTYLPKITSRVSVYHSNKSEGEILIKKKYFTLIPLRP